MQLTDCMSTSNWNLEVLVFFGGGGGGTGEHEENPWSKERTNNKLDPQRSQRWPRGKCLSTVPSILPIPFSQQNMEKETKNQQLDFKMVLFFSENGWQPRG